MTPVVEKIEVEPPTPSVMSLNETTQEFSLRQKEVLQINSARYKETSVLSPPDP